MIIGMVLHAGHRARFAAAARTLAGVTVAWAVYEREDQIRDRVTELLRTEHVDGLLLGQVPFAQARDLLPAELPVAVTRSAALDLALAWARARGNGWPATPVSIDTFDAETVDEVAAALELDSEAIAVLPFQPGQPLDEVVAFHSRQLAATRAAYVISVRTGVAAALDGRTAVLNAVATPGTIRADLHELVLRVRHKDADGRRFAAAVFRPADPGSRADLGRALHEVPEFAEAWIDDRNDEGQVVFAPAAVFEAFTRQWTVLPALGTTVFAGFAIGASARRCVATARRAAERASSEPGSAAFLLSDDGVMIGPIGPTAKAPLEYRYRDQGNGLASLATRARLSPATLSRLAALERSLAGRAISPGELAQALGITDPSGRRLIRKLSESHLAVVDGSTQPHRKGRPARLYRLVITTAGATS
ncbi:transcriptional regulator [Micromonosporaceae bacterium Da 78-11]